MKEFIHARRMLLEPVPDSEWASEMVLNPAMIQDRNTGRIHMLFRATGPWRERKVEGKPLPYPIFLGYGWSDDEGKTWSFDLKRPALAPAMENEIQNIYRFDDKGRRVPNYANGCIEDPRLFYFDGECYVIAACRMFPPGPYWEQDEPTQCCPDWIATDRNPFGKAASENVTVNLLFKVNLERLAMHQYEEAFEYITNLTNPEFGEDRDVLLFAQRLRIDGKEKIVMLQRPFDPSGYPCITGYHKPSIMICCAEDLDEFSGVQRNRKILAAPELPWEANRIGASAPPIKISDKEWLFCYHGKQNSEVGYTQSFMILEEQEYGFPIIKHKCTERILIPEERWELPGKFSTPCIFITGMIKVKDKLLLSYGAADEKVGMMEMEYDPLLDYIRQF